jgi:hypothetical protein
VAAIFIRYRIPDKEWRKNSSKRHRTLLDLISFKMNLGVRKLTVESMSKNEQMVFCHRKFPSPILGPVSIMNADMTIPVSVNNREYLKGVNLNISLK